MRIWVPLAVMLMTGLAGCADSAPVEEYDEFSEAFDEELEATDETGVIRGVVVDPAIVPIPEATVKVKGTEKETTTNENGEFGFADLEPGAYFLDVSKVGFSSIQASAEVEAGVDKPPVIRVQLEPDTSNIPTAELLTFKGFLHCGIGIPGAGSVNPCFVLPDSANTFVTPVQKEVTMVQVEATWKGTNVLGDGLSMGILRPGTTSNFANSDGPSPRILPVEGEQMISELGEGYEDYMIRVFPGRTSPSVVLQQDFDIYTTNFYGFTADDGWTFIEDGEHPVPS